MAIRQKTDGQDLVFVDADLSYGGKETELLRLKAGSAGAEADVHVNGSPAGTLGTNTVVWAPGAHAPAFGSYVKTWAEAVDAVQKMTGETTIEIYADVDEDPVMIPGGNWQLNRTLIVGKTVDDTSDTENIGGGDATINTTNRGWQELLYVVTEGDVNNPTWIKGCRGLKDMVFRPTDFDWSYYASNSNGAIIAFDSENQIVTFQKNPSDTDSDAPFTQNDVGKQIRIGDVSPWQNWDAGADTGDNNGTFTIIKVIDRDTVQFYNFGSPVAPDANNGSIAWSKSTSIFNIALTSDDDDMPAALETHFILDNCDLRYGGDYNWGAIWVGYDDGTGDYADLYLEMKNGSSIRWFSIGCDNYMTVQTDGTGCWVGSLAFAGAGFVDVYPMGGTQVRTYQNAIDDWQLHQPYTVYLPNNESDWTAGVPATVAEALDQLAARIKAQES